MNAEMERTHGEAGALGRVGALRIFGRVKQPLLIPWNDLNGMVSEEVTDLPIFCGDGTPKGRITGLRGVLLENVIRMAEVIQQEDNDTKRMFIVASGWDGYKVVFSWQEIFNTPIGGGVMILIERDGKSLCEEKGGPELISTEDYFTGSRYVKGLESIEVLLAE